MEGILFSFCKPASSRNLFSLNTQQNPQKAVGTLPPETTGQPLLWQSTGLSLLTQLRPRHALPRPYHFYSLCLFAGRTGCQDGCLSSLPLPQTGALGRPDGRLHTAHSQPDAREVAVPVHDQGVPWCPFGDFDLKSVTLSFSRVGQAVIAAITAFLRVPRAPHTILCKV